MTKTVARLYEQFQPTNYDLTLGLDPDALTFTGTVVVRGKKTGRPSQRITFHQNELKITEAKIVKHDKKGDQEITVSRINNQNSLNEVRLHSEAMIYPGEYTVTMTFEGSITRPMHGIYPCFFKHDGKDKKLLATQFESHFAREAFPCIDEPIAKATFDLTILTPDDPTTSVIANTPVSSETTVKDKRVTVFETTPKMSSYLLAFVYGEIGYTSATTKDGVEVRAYATPDNVALTEHGLQSAVKLLEFFDDYFGVPYPLKKLDIAALPDFTVGAMENWGLITFREQTMLVDPKHGSIESKQIVSLVVAHEMSHQWFGDLVTMEWWDDLWLNESFANMMEYLSVDAIYPEWHMWEQFVSHEMVSAKRRDSLVDVQSIHLDVHHPDEINTIFDPSIVYAKGGSVLYMVLNHIGKDAFRAGLQAYFKKHAYGSTVAGDLWEALGQASKQDVSALTHKWLYKPGYPIVSVDWTPGDTEAKLDQTRFLSDPKAVTDDVEPWHVPLASSLKLDKPELTKISDTVKLITKAGTAPFLLNHDGHSYFLPRYKQAAHLQHIINALKRNELSVTDRFLLLDNYIMLQRGGISSTTELLDLLSAYVDESSETVWGSIAMSLAEARRLTEGHEPSEQKLDELIGSLVIKLAESLGWDDKPSDSAQTLRLRGLVIAIACGAKVQSMIDEGLKRFAAFKQPNDLSPSTRSTVYYIGARFGTDADFEKLLTLHNTLQSADEKEEVAGSLTSVKEPARYQKIIKLLTSEHIRRQDLLHWFAWLIRNRYARDATWQWMVDEWQWIIDEFAGDKSYDYFPRFAGSVFSHPSELEKFTKFFDDKRDISLGRNIMLAEQEIASRIDWRERNEATVKQWLAKL